MLSAVSHRRAAAARGTNGVLYSVVKALGKPIKRYPAHPESEAKVSRETLWAFSFGIPPTFDGDKSHPLPDVKGAAYPYNGVCRRSNAMSSENSSGMKLIRFFRLVGILGGVALFARALIIIAIISGILYFLL